MNVKKKTDFINKSSTCIYLFSNLPLSIKNLYDLRLVCKLWCKSISTILSIYKSTQYKLPLQRFSKLEKQFYLTHCYEFPQHFNLISKCIVSLDNKTNILFIEKLINYYSTSQKKFFCKELACKRNCTIKPKIEEILEICYSHLFLYNKICRKWIMKKLYERSDRELIFLMPWLLKICSEHFKIAEESIIPLCVRSRQLMFAFFFECRFYMLDLIYKQKLIKIYKVFIKEIGEKNSLEIFKLLEFIKLINLNVQKTQPLFKIQAQINSFFQKNVYILIPWNVKVKCIGALTEGIRFYNSATNPIKIPLIVQKDNKEQILNILIKNEDIRKDKLTMIIAHMLQKVCGNLVNITIYNVLPINNNYGWIEMIEESNTLYDIKYKYHTTIQNYIMDLNPNMTVRGLRDRFIKTCVSSCVLCYVLGVGDRHLENILVTKDGKLLHIDFSYILGDDPKQFEVEMKITKDMLNMLGGKTSNCFKQFKSNCKKAYRKIRLRSSLWYMLLTYLTFSIPSIDNFKYTYEKIKNHVIERLVPGENDMEASTQIIDIVEKSSNNNWGQQISEWSHIVGNEFRRMKNEYTMFNLEI